MEDQHQNTCRNLTSLTNSISLFFFFYSLKVKGSIGFPSSFFSNPHDLLCFDHRIGTCNLLSSNLLEIERASMIFRVPVWPAKRNPALALESGQPDPFPTNRAPSRLLLLWLLLLFRHRRDRDSRNNRRNSFDFRESQERYLRNRFDGRWRRWRRGRDRRFSRRSLLLFFKTEISVTFRTKIHSRRTS